MTTSQDNLCVRRSTCRICGSGDMELVLPLAPTPIASDFRTAADLDKPQPYYPLDVALCRRCGLAQLLDTVDPTHLYAHAAERTARDSPGMKEHFQRYAEAMRPFKPPTGGFVVEIGSNDGCLLAALQADGWRVVGIDPCVGAAEDAAVQSEQGIVTMAGMFDTRLAFDLRHEYGPVDLIVANNVLANIDDLNDVAEGIRTLLAPGGVFVFETGYLGSLVEHLVFDNIYHEHLSYFSVLPLIKLFADHGLELFDVEVVNTKGGSLRGFVQHARGPRAHTTTAVGLLAKEEQKGLLKPETYQAMGEKLARIRRTLKDVLHGLNFGSVVAGYGASHSIVTLVHHLNIAPMLLFTVDDNPVKHDMMTPGRLYYRLRVSPPERLLSSRVDYTVILPWRFADMIIAKNQNYRDAGGRFIVPIPEVRIV